ncbi:MAG: tautomerase family protein [Micropruina sp.]|nr:tautomerase family protein [Micropruina sp.]
MPIIDVSVVEGRTEPQLRALMSELVRAASETLAVPAESVRVVVREVSPHHWAVGPQTYAEREAGRTA